MEENKPNKIPCEHRFWTSSRTKTTQCLKCKEVVGSKSDGMEDCDWRGKFRKISDLDTDGYVRQSYHNQE